ncbi:hypothetical protein QFC20_002322 [Naganishia adeliensis]|uniref:Uncharacterized protein n=1 Tax=Naganishia adeliensis TaxID=92952 RepID=A0ACC2WM38_9TREE|nr:hypothetical protein QFC20_002322 [Naganishia adeliensis]
MARSSSDSHVDHATNAYKQLIKPGDLPVVSFRIIHQDDDSPSAFERRTKQDKAQLPLPLLDAFGYNVQQDDFAAPDAHYIRHVEPIEVELANQVEYDMDEQDKEWLDAANGERGAGGLDRMSYELFEIVMDKLEKEWFNLVKRIPSKHSNLTNEDSKCAVCDDGEGENSNAIVFCDGCNLAVHQEGQWLCRKCTVEPENPVDCIFCPNEGGAYKQTNKGAWAHLLCAIWIPEVGVSNSVYMEPIEGVETIPKSRWKLVGSSPRPDHTRVLTLDGLKTCYICKQKGGACIQCDTKTCFTAFHVTCARAHGLLGSMKSMNHDGVLRAQCHRHLPADRLGNLAAEGDQGLEKTDRLTELSYREEAATPSASEKRSRKKGIPSDASFPTPAKSKRPVVYAATGKTLLPVTATSKSARAHAKSYTSGPPLVPGIIVASILQYVHKVKLRRMREYVEKICRYWSLKREARRGAPLLKRLYLEPWTASNQSKEQTDAEKARKLEYLIKVRNDLERVRMLAELVRKREQEKLRQARIIKQFVEESLFPFDAALRAAYTKIMEMDRSELFMHPVPPSEAPDYYVIIKEPMYWKAIERKLAEHSYLNLAQFLRDISLVLDNAIHYNIAPGNIYRKLALRIQKAAAPVCASLIEEVRHLGAFPTTAVPEDIELEASEASIRALKEPSGQDQITLLEKLFSYELEPPRPPTPPPKPKHRVDKDEARARKQAKAAKFDEPRIPGRSTRHTVAMGIDSLVHTDEPPAATIDEPEDGVRRKSRRQAAIAVGETSSNAEGARVRRSHTSEVGVDDKRVPSRGRQRSKVDGKTNGVTDSASGELTSASSGEVVPLDKAKRGVVGKETYSPLGPKERRERDKRMAMELVVDNLDSRADFKRFNVGWVLPEGTKRGGDASAKVTETSVSSAVDARSTTETDWRMSVDANGHLSPSAAPENISTNPKPASPAPLRQPSPALSDSSLSSLSELSDVPDGDEGPQADEPKEEGNAPPASRTDIDVSSVSPVTGTRIRKRTYDSDSDYLLPEHYKRPRVQSTLSKDKQSSRKTAIQKMSTPTDSDLSTLSPGGDPPKGGKAQSSKDTTELDEDEEMEDDAEPDDDEQRDERLASLRGTNGSTAVGKWQDPYPDGTLVWAQIKGFPYYPAEIVNADLDYDEIGERVWSEKPKTAGNERVWLVRFYDRTRSYAWVTQGYLANLGDDKDLDEAFLNGKDKSGGGNFKGRRSREAVRKAYEDATAEMEV